MFTPQEIQEQTFSKAVFGGYDMQQVDDFLEPLTEDYITLYKENSVLKAKMKILVEKLEEYRAQETQQSSAVADAQAKSAQMLKEAQAKCAAMLQNAEVNAQSNAQVNAANVQLAQLNQQIHAEQERLDYAKQTALNFISVIERDVQGHLGLLETLKSRDLTKEEAPAQPKSAHEKPYDWQADKTEPAPDPAPSVSTEEIASEISDNLEKLIGSAPETPVVSTPVIEIIASCTRGSFRFRISSASSRLISSLMRPIRLDAINSLLFMKNAFSRCPIGPFVGADDPTGRSAPPAARDFLSEEGARTKEYRVYVESAATQYCRKRSAAETHWKKML